MLSNAWSGATNQDFAMALPRSSQQERRSTPAGVIASCDDTAAVLEPFGNPNLDDRLTCDSKASSLSV